MIGKQELEPVQFGEMPARREIVEKGDQENAGAAWARMCRTYLRDCDTHPDDAYSAINGMRAIATGACGAACLEGFSKTLQGYMIAKWAVTPARLRTQKDGRMFAVELLKYIEDERSENGAFSIIDREPDPVAPKETCVYRTGPQSQAIRRAFDAVYAAPEPARHGFFAVMTDYLGQSPDGHFFPSGYEEWEADGKIHDDPLPPDGTQKDGRRMAIELLKDIRQWEREAVEHDGIPMAPFAILEHEPGDSTARWRHGAQWPHIRKAFEAIQREGIAVRIGFYAIISDFLAQALGDGSPEPSYYEGFEARGLIKDNPTE